MTFDLRIHSTQLNDRHNIYRQFMLCAVRGSGSSITQTTLTSCSIRNCCVNCVYCFILFFFSVFFFCFIHCLCFVLILFVIYFATQRLNDKWSKKYLRWIESKFMTLFAHDFITCLLIGRENLLLFNCFYSLCVCGLTVLLSVYLAGHTVYALEIWTSEMCDKQKRNYETH